MGPHVTIRFQKIWVLLLAKYRLKYWVTVVTSVMMIQSDGQIMTNYNYYMSRDYSGLTAATAEHASTSRKPSALLQSLYDFSACQCCVSGRELFRKARTRDQGRAFRAFNTELRCYCGCKHLPINAATAPMSLYSLAAQARSICACMAVVHGDSFVHRSCFCGAESYWVSFTSSMPLKPTQVSSETMSAGIEARSILACLSIPV